MAEHVDKLTPVLVESYPELSARDFYRWLFPAGDFEVAGTAAYVEYTFDKGSPVRVYRYNAIAVEVTDKRKKVPYKRWDPTIKDYVDDPTSMREKPVVRRYTVTDDLDVIDHLQNSPYFCLMSPLSYVGKARTAENARMCYAIVIDLDHIKQGELHSVGLYNLLREMDMDPADSAYSLPLCSAIVSSGTGVHLYYILDEPIPLYAGNVDALQRLKRALTDRVWNTEVVDIKDRRDVQQEGIYQGFRIVGTCTKVGSRARAFRCGEKVSIDELNKYVPQADRAVLRYRSKSGVKWDDAAARWPEWAAATQRKNQLSRSKEELQRQLFSASTLPGSDTGQDEILARISEIDKELAELDGRKVWTVNRALYDWWLRKIKEGAIYGHRYWCIAMLAVYARKCSYYDGDREVVDEEGKKKIKKGKNKHPVTYEELEQDAYDLIPYLDGLSRDNRFTEDDVLAALEYYNDGWQYYPRANVEYHTAIAVPANARRRDVPLPQAYHLEDARDHKKKMKRRGIPFRAPEGRPDKRAIVQDWQISHPDGRKSECIKDTGLSKATVYRWWNNER